ncbi:DUF2637 domain-containing protein [Actinopolymorpha pittospori]|uniref:DUF2637 domain-containing protein n=1 Tax=Actinopolymorpha pittospori TaxID=648752 RepID=A0A927RQC1_9ACTN|nr:DUF2637 domain-containing protein [Actinopolymorpha pittospori]MBE1612063.1 hypothetical protein [Actinopolymorpha pittospori]
MSATGVWTGVRDLTRDRPTVLEENAPADVRCRPLSDPELAATVVVGVLVGLLGLIGLVTSFATVAAAAAPAFGRLAWLVPVGVDVGILVFSALDLVLARLDMRVVWLRLVPWSLTAATIYLNVAEQSTVFGQVAHAVLPGMWVVAIEVGTHAIRVRAGLASARRMDSIRRSRWLLAPVSTLGLWRRMVLWEITAYPDALHRERARLLALTELKDRYGHLHIAGRTARFPAAWRWNAPRRERALYRLGEHIPHHDQAEPAPALAPPMPTTPRPIPRPKATTKTGSRSRRSTVVPDVVDLVPAAEAAAERIAARGEDLTRKALAAQLRADGHQVGNAKLGTLLEHLRNRITTDSSSGDETLRETSE